MAALWGCAAARYRCVGERPRPAGGGAPLVVSRGQGDAGGVSPAAAVERYMQAQTRALRRYLTGRAAPLQTVQRNDVRGTASPKGPAFGIITPHYRRPPSIAVKQVGEGIWVSIQATVLFDTACGDLHEAGKRALAGVAEIVRAYRGTHVLVVGCVDGERARLAKGAIARERAATVVDQLLLRGVGADRVSETLRWSAPPAFDRHVRAARSYERVVLAIYATSALREAAADGALAEKRLEREP